MWPDVSLKGPDLTPPEECADFPGALRLEYQSRHVNTAVQTGRQPWLGAQGESGMRGRERVSKATRCLGL